MPNLVLRTLGALVAIAGIGLTINAVARVPWPPPIVITHTVSLAQFGLRVTLPSTWKLEPGLAKTDFVATHFETGATLVGAVTLSASPPAELDFTIDRLIEDQRSRLGTAEIISRGVIAVGLLDAHWAKLSFSRHSDLQMKALAVQRGLSTLTLICTGPAAAQKACDAAIQPETMAR